MVPQLVCKDRLHGEARLGCRGRFETWAWVYLAGSARPSRAGSRMACSGAWMLRSTRIVGQRSGATCIMPREALPFDTLLHPMCVAGHGCQCLQATTSDQVLQPAFRAGGLVGRSFAGHMIDARFGRAYSFLFDIKWL
jgi:hypothetical protein